MARRIRVCGMSTYAARAVGVAVGVVEGVAASRDRVIAAGCRATAGSLLKASRASVACCMSRRTTRPPGPVPRRSAMDRPASLARRRASGLLKMRPPIPSPASPAGVTGIGLGVGAPDEAVEVLSARPNPTPSSASRAPRSSTSSPGSPSRAIGAPTSTMAPAGTSVLRMTPLASAGTSTTAFSVSTVAMASCAVNCVFSGTGHSASTASTALAATSGMRSNRAMSVPRDLGELGGDFLAPGDRRPFEHLADAR